MNKNFSSHQKRHSLVVYFLLRMVLLFSLPWRGWRSRSTLGWFSYFSILWRLSRSTTDWFSYFSIHWRFGSSWIWSSHCSVFCWFISISLGYIRLSVQRFSVNVIEQNNEDSEDCQKFYHGE